MQRIRLGRLAVVLLVLNSMVLMTGCEQRFFDSIQNGFFGFVTDLTVEILDAAVPVPAPAA